MSGVMNTPDGQDPQMLQAAIQMLSNSTIRDFHIAVEADSLAQIDEQAEKQGAQEAIQAIGLFLREAIPMIAQAPETLPMASEMLLFLVRRFRAGRGLESAVERAMKALQDKADAAKQQPPSPPPEMLKLQADQQAEQMRMQAQAQSEQMKMQADAQLAQAQAQAESILCAGARSFACAPRRASAREGRRQSPYWMPRCCAGDDVFIFPRSP